MNLPSISLFIIVIEKQVAAQGILFVYLTAQVL